MDRILLLHGICDKEEFFDEKSPSLSNSHWFPWLQKKFITNGYDCQTPEMPTPYAPKYKEWKKVFEELYNKDTKIIIAHSAGCGFILKWLQENPKEKIEHLVLAAPWFDEDKTLGEFLNFDYTNFNINQVNYIDLLYSNDDEDEIVEASKVLEYKFFEILPHEFENKGHFTSASIGNKFKELWDIFEIE